MKMKKLISALCAGAIALSLMSVSAFAEVELPTATVTELGDVTLESGNEWIYGVQFDAEHTSIDEIEDKAYRNWVADFKISFNKDVDADDLKLVGNYGTYGWVEIDLANDVQAGEEVTIMSMYDSTDKITYKQVVQLVKSFQCGIAKVKDSDADFSDLVATVELCLYDNDNNEYVIASVSNLPGCTVADLEAGMNLGDGYALLYGAKFTAEHTSLDEIEDEPYRNYVADFEITFDKDIAAGNIALVGNYGTYGWVKVPVEQDIVAGTTYRVMQMYDPSDVITYKQVVQSVGNFMCGVARVPGSTADLTDLTATVELCLYNDDDRYSIASVSYNNSELENLPGVNATQLTGDSLKFTAIDGNDYAMIAGMQFDAVHTSISEIENELYRNYAADFEVTFNKDVTKDDIALAGYYAKYAEATESTGWVVLDIPEEGIAANTPVRVMKLYDDATVDYDGILTYKDVVSFVKSFKCGVVAKNNVEGLKATVQLCLYETARDADGNLYEVDKKYEVSETYEYDLATWIYAQDAGYYDVEGEKSGLIRFLFGTNFGVEIAKVGVKFVDASEIQKYFNSVEVTDYKGSFYGDITDISEDMSDKTFYAIGYAVDVNGIEYWSDVQTATPNFTKLFK